MTLKIRPATEADMPRLIAMGRAQLAATYGDAVADNPSALAALGATLLSSPTGAIFVAERDGVVIGMIGLVVFTHHLSGVLTAGEVMWWLDPEARGAGLTLLKRAERWAAEAGARVIQMTAPEERVGRLYERRGYRAVETTYQAPVTAAMTALAIHDDVLPDFGCYVAASRAQPVGDVEPSPGLVFRGIAPPIDHTLAAWIHATYPTLTPTLSFLRQSPAGQQEPNYVHTDRDMGDWTAIAYLTEAPPPGDGTTFWRHTTGAIRSTARTDEELAVERDAWRDQEQWEPWTTVEARPNRVVLFPAPYFHSRALPENYGVGDTARFIQVVFGTGALSPVGGE